MDFTLNEQQIELQRVESSKCTLFMFSYFQYLLGTLLDSLLPSLLRFYIISNA